MRILRSFYKACRALTLLTAISPLPVLTAAELTDLYQAKVPAGQSQAQWQRQAMQAVLLKLTGSQAQVSQPMLTDALRNSAHYVVQYQQVQQDGAAWLLVTLDGQKLTQLLQQQQIPIWGARRPDVLIWLTERPIDQPQFVLSPEHPLRKALQSEAASYGLSLQFPLFDDTDTALITEAASWGGDWALLNQASGRYQADEVYNLLFDQITDATGLVQFRLTWQQQLNGEVQSKELLNADAMQLASQFCAELASAQASRYAVRVMAPVLSQGDSSTNELELTVDGISSLSDLVALRRLFASQLTVHDHSVLQYQAGRAVLKLQLASSRDEFYRALSLVRELTPVSDGSIAEPAPQTADSTLDLAANAASNTADNAADHTAAQTGAGVSDELQDAEAAMEAALAGPVAANTVTMPTTGTTPVLSDSTTAAATANAAGNITVQAAAPVISNHFRFKRL